MLYHKQIISNLWCNQWKDKNVSRETLEIN